MYLPGTTSNGFQKPPRKFVVPIGKGSSHALDGTANHRRTSGNNLDGFNFGPHHQSQDEAILNDISVNSVS